MNDRVEAILDYWFGDCVAKPESVVERNKKWFETSAELDAEIRDHFAADVEQARSSELTEWESTPRGLLALILLLDQFTRNIYRGKAEAFAGDPLALEYCQRLIRSGQDQELAFIERVFAYIPLEHSEELAIQEQSIAQFSALVESAPAELKQTFQSNYQYAVKHYDIIKRFGRFPHRNAILGRESTAEEIQYLNEGGETFGQVASS